VSSFKTQNIELFITTRVRITNPKRILNFVGKSQFSNFMEICSAVLECLHSNERVGMAMPAFAMSPTFVANPQKGHIEQEQLVLLRDIYYSKHGKFTWPGYGFRLELES
jgi:hypothetical protein